MKVSKRFLAFIASLTLIFTSMPVYATEDTGQTNDEQDIEAQDDDTGTPDVSGGNASGALIDVSTLVECDSSIALVAPGDLYFDYVYAEDGTATGYSLKPADTTYLDSETYRGSAFFYNMSLYGADTRYKILSYNPTDNTLWYNTYTTQEAISSFDGSTVYNYTMCLNNSTSLTDALSNAMIDNDKVSYSYSNGTGEVDAVLVPYNLDTWILYFSPDATDMSGLVYACQLKNLVNHVWNSEIDKQYNTDTTFTKVDEEGSTYGISLKETLVRNNYTRGAIYTVSWDLKGYIWNGTHQDEKVSGGFITNTDTNTRYAKFYANSTSGSKDIEIYSLDNGNYQLEIQTTANRSYYVNFTVDFITQPENRVKTISTEQATVTFEGIPSENINIGESFTLKMITSNIVTTKSFNGFAISNGEYTTTSEVTITENGSYNYSAVTESGVVTKGVLTINCFVSPKYDNSDPTLFQSLESLVAETLTQTGMKAPLIGFGVAFVGIGSFLIYRKRDFIKSKLGGKNNAK